MLCVLIVAEVVQGKKTMIRTYTELQRLRTFEERYKYLQLRGVVGESTFGFDRYLNQLLYSAGRWKRTRDKIIIRDNACDLGMDGYDIHNKILVHHMNPITMEDIELERDTVYDPEFLICTCMDTHNAIHFGDESLLPKLPVQRKRNDTCPWKL
jgi:hypothetical protein